MIIELTTQGYILRNITTGMETAYTSLQDAIKAIPTSPQASHKGIITFSTLALTIIGTITSERPTWTFNFEDLTHEGKTYKFTIGKSGKEDFYIDGENILTIQGYISKVIPELLALLPVEAKLQVTNMFIDSDAASAIAQRKIALTMRNSKFADDALMPSNPPVIISTQRSNNDTGHENVRLGLNGEVTSIDPKTWYGLPKVK